MNKTKIEWADFTWNPVTGCLHGCAYCYAKRIANRFGGASETHHNETVGTECQWATESTGEIHDLSEPIYDVDRGHDAPYPFYFDPTFHRYRLDEPQKIKKPSRIFVVSMGDLFGGWVPDIWVEGVFRACDAAPWHTYLFLTKNPKRYGKFWAKGILPKHHWYGHTVTTNTEAAYAQTFDPTRYNNFLSIEPLLGDASKGNWIHLYKWVIIGAQTGPGAVKPKPEWVQSIINKCRDARVPVFLKDNLRWRERIQEFPVEEACRDA